MKINELKIVSAKDLNESLAKTFGTKLRLQDFTNEQLEDARNRLRTQLSQVETNESFDTVHTSDAYQKGRMFLDVINQEMHERAKAKPDYIDIDGDGNKKEPMKKAAKAKEAKKDEYFFALLHNKKHDKYWRGLFDDKLTGEYYNLPRQNLPKTYHPNGYIDIVRPKQFMYNDSFHGSHMLAFETEFAYEVDTENDFKILQAVYGNH